MAVSATGMTAMIISFLSRLVVTALAVYLGIVLLAWVFQRKLLYFPTVTRVAPAGEGLVGVSERVLQTPDGQQVLTWSGGGQPGFPTILYFHGNGGNLATRASRMGHYLKHGYGMTIMSYRGFSGSTGSPSERANIADALLAFDALVANGIPARDIIVYGESLGSGVATQVAAARPVGGIILDAPYTSTPDVGADTYWFLPVRLLMSDRYETIRHIKKVTAPLLIVHGERDSIIPVAMGRAVHAAATSKKEIAIFPRAGHADHWEHGSYDVIFRWLAAWRAAR
jgi:uncharacterized protein